MKTVHWRLFTVFIVFALAGFLILARLFSLQILNYREFAALAARQHGDGQFDPPRRGAIYFQDKDGNLRAAALNNVLYTVAVAPNQVEEPDLLAERLGEILKIPPPAIKKKLERKDDPYEVILRRAGDEEVGKIRALQMKGIVLTGESKRVYPGGSLGAHVVGFVKFDPESESGQYGIEREFERELAGETGFLEGIGNSFSSLISLGKRIVHPPQNGKNVVLTLDYQIQKRAEESLAAVAEKWQAESGNILVIDPNDGRIKALAAYPAFDPNQYGKAKDIGVFLNPVAQATYELGSVMKPITMAASINEGAVTPMTTYHDPGEIKIKGSTIKNFDGQSHGTQTMTNVLEKSLNTGAVFAATKLGQEKFEKYLKLFGLGEKTGVDLPGEVAGNISNLAAGRAIDFATAAFGQGITATPLQLAMGLATIANGGNLVKPVIIDKLIDDAGNEERYEPDVKRQVITKETSEKLTEMLVSVTKNGFDNRAGVKGYFVAGKTGTAQIPNRAGRGYSDEVIHSFVGYAPAFKPKFLVFIQLNKPKGVRFASSSLTPVFHDLAAFILNYYNVPPDAT